MEKANGMSQAAVRYLCESLLSLKERLSSLKQRRCATVWSKICQTPVDDKVEINDALWANVKATCEEPLAGSLVKFFSSFICQTGTFELTKSFFLFNLAAAADQRKFFLHETLLE